MRLAALAPLALLLGAAPPQGGSVVVEVSGLRSAKGLVRACLTALPAAFPDCRDDPHARELTVAAAQASALAFPALPPGRYAVALLHDENGNGRADMALMVPREGFGFSRNPKLRFGPPRFARAAFLVGDGQVRQAVRMRYLL